MTRIGIVLIFLMAGVYVNAQPIVGKTYAETKREQDIKAYNDRYNEANRNQRNSSLGTGGGVDQKAAQQLSEQFRLNAGKVKTTGGVTFEQAEASEQRKREKEINEWAAERAKARKKHESRLEAFNQNVVEFLDLGFTRVEADHLADNLTRYSTANAVNVSSSSSADEKRAADVVAARRVFLKNRDTMSMQTQLDYIYRFKYAGLTACQELQKLEKQHPEFKKELMYFELLSLPSLFFWESDLYDTYMMSRLHEERRKGYKRFWEIYAEEPKMAFLTLPLYAKLAASPVHGFYIPTENYTLEQKNELKAFGILSGILESNRVEQYCIDLAQGNNENYWLQKPREYWVKMAGLIDQTPADVIGRFANAKTSLKTINEEHYCASMFRAPSLVSVLKKLSDEGDVSCMNAYAVQLAFPAYKSDKVDRHDRRKGFELMQQAAEKGSTWAKMNLLYCASKKMNGLKNPEAIKETYTNEILNGSVTLQYNVVEGIMFFPGPPFKNDPFMKEFAHTVCKKLADGGNKQAQEWLANIRW